MSDEHNPLIPAGYDIVWSLAAAIVIALAIVALVTLARSGDRLTPTQGLLWAALVLLVPVLGPIAWLTTGRKTTTNRRSTE
ncbi:hypothetical protein GCM10025760_26180 [Microbacterium yannicii]|uniref:Cardiolipin synthase N-terminal domain-containing protein n=1 Tax=Microbacterium yannicii TaxID=671622 RepID=A0ABP9MGH0_9MICO|nr:PLDc N-terminal domain-containing protein [Microbacterium yannicii]MCO5952997.1 PLDc N-terminal domain-containing protein [Microbacterium yannicii]